MYGDNLNILHFYDSMNAWNVRLQRFIQHDFDMSLHPILFARDSALNDNYKWIPDSDNITVCSYHKSRALAYMLPLTRDPLNLQYIFDIHNCDLVHAHNLPCAYYSHRLGLPTVFNDWEYHHSYYDYASPKRNRLSIPFRMYRRRIAKKVLKELLANISIIVTNKNVAEKYRELGAVKIWTVPNVPLQFEVDTTSKLDIEKKQQLTTCYVGNITVDNYTTLRNTLGVQELWQRKYMGNLLTLEGSNYVPHLEIFRILKACHFNLLYWHPLDVHKYYLQNKPFLASVVGVPTIISDSLSATIELLGDFAIPVHTLQDVEKAVQSNLWSNTHYYPKPTHIFEYYTPKIIEAYK